jgi:hypothetical protein
LAQKPLSYDHLAIVSEKLTPAEQPTPATDQPDSDLLRDVAQQVVVYLNPDFHRAITRYALERSAFRAKVKTHDLIVEALETWAAAHGINLPVRAKEVPQPKRKGRHER